MKIRISTSPPMIGKRIKAKTYLGKTGADANMVTTAADGKSAINSNDATSLGGGMDGQGRGNI